MGWQRPPAWLPRHHLPKLVVFENAGACHENPFHVVAMNFLSIADKVQHPLKDLCCLASLSEHSQYLSETKPLSNDN